MKMGMAVGDAVVFFRKELALEFEYRCKQAGQLSSKMRFLAAPWIGMLQDGAWLRHAAHANRCARVLAEGLNELAGARLIAPTEANGVFVNLPIPAIEALRAKGWRFYTFIGSGGVRLMCSWDTTLEDVAELLSDIRQVLA